MTAFPSWLPLPSRNYGADVDPYLATTEFEVGLRQRRRYSTAQERVGVTWEMSQLEYDAFCHFVREEISFGAMPFDISILGVDGLETRNAQMMGGKFSARVLGVGFYSVSATLLCEASAGMDAEIFALLGTPEMGDIDSFYLISTGLYLYIETTYGTGTI